MLQGPVVDLEADMEPVEIKQLTFIGPRCLRSLVAVWFWM
jgi:hypothetical protein